MKYIALLVLSLWTAASSFGQTKPLRIVFDISSKDTATHSAVIRHVAGMQSAYKDARFEIVIYGPALPMVLKEKSSVAKKLSQLAAHDNVDVKVCSITMARQKAVKEDLVAGVEPVPDAILEIVTRQGEGWGYIKESHN